MTIAKGYSHSQKVDESIKDGIRDARKAPLRDWISRILRAAFAALACAIAQLIRQHAANSGEPRVFTDGQ